ncbi:hypothetical protein McanMca71_002316 [Microsporum canis]|uniref:HMG box-containing protein n=1 Tax=Arthroderma otae (strain ATCC MYA-4605 / CBS 113480) TaxID=554155 RepID=C5FL56_ARTOC|nr:HMG box-containing protein [Microsporum canis CBS 113480]EEQ30428.1 HMG box-containing protein [Microsporum canis CBS 113480]
MARLYTKPNDESRVGKTNVRSRAKESVKDTVAAGNDGTEDELPSRNTGGRKKQSGSEDSTRRTTKSQEHIDDQEKLTAQLSDLSLTSKRNKKVQPAGGVNLERGDEEDVVRRLTQLRLQGVCHSDEEKETENNISDKAEDRVQNVKKGGIKYISSLPGRRSSDSEGQGEESIIGPTDADDTDGFDSLDDFIVSDNESLGLYEDSEFEDEEEEDGNDYKEDLKENVKTHPPSQTHLNSDTEPEPEPQSRPRRRLIRGRRKPTCSSSPHALGNGTCDIAENTPGPSAEPLLSSNIENNTTCPAGQEETGPDTDITTDLLSDFKLFLPPPISSTASEDFKNQNKAPMDLTPTKKMGKRAKNSSQGTTQPSPEPPQERNSQMGFVTPPTSPSKPRLKSPSKSQKNRIPPSPHRPSIDMFWSQEVVNQWNDKFSPRKTQTPKFHRRHFDIFSDTDEDDDEEDQSLGNQDDDCMIADVSIPKHLGTPDPDSLGDKLPLHTSPIKNNASPSKKQTKASASTKKALAAKRREFDEQKHALATDFFNKLDNMVTGGEILKLTKSAGGVNIVWNNKLATTAGRATWKKELITKTRDSTEQQLIGSSSANLCSPNTSSPHAPSAINSLAKPKLSPSSKRSSTTRSIRHNATIELAEKVIDSEDRLLNTLAHEYCHLANFMISGVLNQPHGASFKQWAKKCKTALDSNPEYSGKVEVNTKHSYLINYKYMWCCETCGQEYGRHSKSIDPAKVRCGKCYDGQLSQVKPKPRGKAKA